MNAQSPIKVMGMVGSHQLRAGPSWASSTAACPHHSNEGSSHCLIMTDILTLLQPLRGHSGLVLGMHGTACGTTSTRRCLQHRPLHPTATAPCPLHRLPLRTTGQRKSSIVYLAIFWPVVFLMALLPAIHGGMPH
eukprot:Colp12_sorted_trinity150504_noHs@1059